MKAIFWCFDRTIGGLVDVNLVGSSVWSINILGFNLTDPVAVTSHIFATHRIYSLVLLGGLIPLIFTLIFGRIFCGWICPMNFILEMNAKLRNLLQKDGVDPEDIHFSREYKYFVLGLGLLLSALFGIQFLPVIYPPAVIGREIASLVSYRGAGIGTCLIILLMIFELSFSERWWCRYICPGGAVYSLLGSSRILQIRKDAEKCNNCLKCKKVCPLGLNPAEGEVGMECTNCGVCYSNCPTKAVGYKLGIPKIANLFALLTKNEGGKP
ncbi:MAG: 4Fe-4S binding protein [Actinomycetota bacterium]|nr:4Fe-4S binding protein [Actinomycetota bacterium]